MATYKLDENLDKNKMFLVDYSELDSRIDPHPYHKERFDVVEKLQKIENLYLKKVAKFSKKIISDIKDSDTYIGLENIKSNTGCYIETGSKDSISSANVFTAGQILFPKLRPYLNKVYWATFDGICSTEFHVLESNLENINNKYLYIYLQSNLVVSQTKHLMTGNTLPRLQTEDVKNILVPIIDEQTQAKIVQKYEQAYQQKQQKEQKAKELLASIDTYLLDVLGITLPKKDNSLQSRIFTTDFSDVSGGRFDPKLYDTNTTGIKLSISNSKHVKQFLKDLVIHSATGDWGEDEQIDDLINHQRCLVIRATEFDNEYNLKLDNSRVKYRMIKQSKLLKIDIKENDLLIEKSGGSPAQPVGRISILDNEVMSSNRLCFSNFVHKIRVDDTVINPMYLFLFLKVMHNIKLTDSMQSQTNGIRNLIMSNYFSQQIPLPPLTPAQASNGEISQQKIVLHISAIRAEAKQLQAQATADLEATKAEIEKMILGGA